MDKKDKVKEALKKKLKQETSVTGTGASVTPGVGAGVATKYAFGKRTNKGTPSDWKNAPSIPNRKSKAMDYKELWEVDEAYTPSSTNAEELARVEELLAQANRDNAYSVMSSYEFRIKALRLLVALEKKYNTTLPLFKFGMMVSDYLAKYFPGFKGKFGPYNQNWKSVKDHIEQSMSQKQDMNEVDTSEEEKMLTGGIPFKKESGKDYDKITITEPLPDDVKDRMIKKFLDAKWDAKPNNVGGITAVKKKLFVSDNKLNKNEKNIEEAYVPENIKKFAQRKGVTNTVNQVARWAEKMGKRIVGGTAIGKDYSTLLLDLTYQGGEIRINTDTDEIEINDQDIIDYQSFADAVDSLSEPINENYARFRNETKTRTKPEQFHNAVKEVKKKVQEINRLFEYMGRLQSELKESEGGLKTKKYTENALQQIKEATKQLFFKSTKLK